MSVVCRSPLLRSQKTRKPLATVDVCAVHHQSEQDESHVTQVSQSAKIAAESRRHWNNRLTVMINSGSRTRRQFVRQRCRRLIGWDPYDGFELPEDEDVVRTNPTGRKPIRAPDEPLVNTDRQSKSVIMVENDGLTVDVNGMAQITSAERDRVEFEQTVAETGNQRRLTADETSSLPRIVVDHVTDSDPGVKQIHRLNIVQEESGITRHHGNKAKLEDSRKDEGDMRDDSDVNSDVDRPQHGNESPKETSQVQIITEEKLRKSEDNASSESRHSVTENRESTTTMSSLSSVERKSPIIDEYDHLLYRISTNLRQQTKAAAFAGGQSPDFRRSLDNVIHKGYRAHERRLQQRRSTGVSPPSGVTVVRDRTDSTGGSVRHSGGDRPETDEKVSERHVVAFDCAVRDLSAALHQRVSKTAPTTTISDRRTMRNSRSNDVAIDASSIDVIGKCRQSSCRWGEAVDLGDNSDHVVPTSTDGNLSNFEKNHEAEAKETKAELSQTIATCRTEVESIDLPPSAVGKPIEKESPYMTINVAPLDKARSIERDGSSDVDDRENSNIYFDSGEAQRRRTRGNKLKIK